MTNLTNEQLAAELTRRQQEAARRAEEEEAVRQAETARRAQAVIAGYAAQEERLMAAEKAAYAAFREAVLADPMVAAYIRYRWHRFRRDGLRTEFNVAASLLNLGQHKDALRWTDPRLLEEVVGIADREAKLSAEEDTEAAIATLR